MLLAADHALSYLSADLLRRARTAFPLAPTRAAIAPTGETCQELPINPNGRCPP
jgi:hypothetical protein